MAYKRKEPLVNGQYYHVLNKAIASEEIFTSKRELNRAIELLSYYRFRQSLSFSRFKKLSVRDQSSYLNLVKNSDNLLVEIYAFAFMPDHFHLLVKQLKDNGIKLFLSNLQNGYAKYYNILNKRDGSLFKRPFLTKLINTDEKFNHVSRYIHLNPVTSYLIDFIALKNYPFTSYPYYSDLKDDDLINTGFIIKMFGTSKNYQKFVADQVDYQRMLGRMKKLVLEKIRYAN